MERERETSARWRSPEEKRSGSTRARSSWVNHQGMIRCMAVSTISSKAPKSAGRVWYCPRICAVCAPAVPVKGMSMVTVEAST